MTFGDTKIPPSIFNSIFTFHKLNKFDDGRLKYLISIHMYYA